MKVIRFDSDGLGPPRMRLLGLLNPEFLSSWRSSTRVRLLL